MGDDKVLVIGNIKLTKNEKSALLLNPKYGIFGEINEEEVQKELEVGGVKTRWDMMSNIERYEETAVMLEAPEEEGTTLTEARGRQTFDHESNSIKFSSKRATDYKQNASIYLPKAVNIKRETEIGIRKAKPLEVAKEVKGEMSEKKAYSSNLSK